MQDKKAVKREIILDTAFELILENGFTNTRIIDIANKAGIGKGTVYAYFESKQMLLLELLNTRVRQDYVNVCSAMDKAPTCKQKLADFFLLEIETAAKYKSNITDFGNEYIKDKSDISTEIVEAIHGIMEMQFGQVQNVVMRGIDAGEFRKIDARAVAACIMGGISFCLHMASIGQPCSEDSFLDCIFNGLLL